MKPVLFLLLLSLRTAELRSVSSDPGIQLGSTQDTQRQEDAGTPAAEMDESPSLEKTSPDPVERWKAHVLRRGAKGGNSRKRDPHFPSSYGQQRRHDDPDSFFTTPRDDRSTSAPTSNVSTGRGSGFLNPLFPFTDGAYWAYAVMLLALVLFAAGIVGNLALMCIVWHNFYLKSAWNCILAGLAFWDFLVLFFCLPVVVFHELTLRRLLGDLSCRLVPYLEVTSLGVATFSVCALSIDRFHAATSPAPLQSPKVEPCQSILSKLAVIWVGSMLLAAPELLLWQLLQETVSLPMLPTDLQQSQLRGSLITAFRTRTEVFKVDICVREPSVELPENIYSLVLTYHEARMWWFFGCYICLPLLFTLACDLVTRQVLAQRLLQKPEGDKVTSRCSSASSASRSSSKKKKQHVREHRLRSTVMALTILYITCNLPESICNITLAYISVPTSSALPALIVPALGLIGQFLLFVRCSATPVLLLCLCRSLGQAFMDCCCCCCEECLPDSNSSSSSSASAAATSTLSSPTSLSPSSLSPSCKEETMKSLLEAEPVLCDRAKDSIGTPC